MTKCKDGGSKSKGRGRSVGKPFLSGCEKCAKPIGGFKKTPSASSFQNCSLIRCEFASSACWLAFLLLLLRIAVLLFLPEKKLLSCQIREFSALELLPVSSRLQKKDALRNVDHVTGLSVTLAVFSKTKGRTPLTCFTPSHKGPNTILNCRASFRCSVSPPGK